MKLLILISILLISSVSALTLYGGDSHTFETNISKPAYIIQGNTYNLTGLEFLFNGTHITLTIAQNYKPDNFTIIFFDMDEEIKVPVKEVRVGGTRTIYEDRNITEYKEIPIFIDKEIEIEIEKEIPSDPRIIKEIPTGTLLAIGLLLGLITVLIRQYIIERRKKNE